MCDKKVLQDPRRISGIGPHSQFKVSPLETYGDIMVERGDVNAHCDCTWVIKAITKDHTDYSMASVIETMMRWSYELGREKGQIEGLPEDRKR